MFALVFAGSTAQFGLSCAEVARLLARGGYTVTRGLTGDVIRFATFRVVCPPVDWRRLLASAGYSVGYDA